MSKYSRIAKRRQRPNEVDIVTLLYLTSVDIRNVFELKAPLLCSRTALIPQTTLWSVILLCAQNPSISVSYTTKRPDDLVAAPGDINPDDNFFDHRWWICGLLMVQISARWKGCVGLWYFRSNLCCRRDTTADVGWPETNFLHLRNYKR